MRFAKRYIPRPRGTPSRLVVFLLLTAGAGCGEAPSAPGAPRRTTGLQAEATPDGRANAYGCYVSEAVQGAPFRYTYTRRPVQFPDHVAASPRPPLTYRLRFQRRGEEPVLVANCTIPRSRSAIQLLEALFRVPESARLGRDDSRSEITIQTTFTDEPCINKPGDNYDDCYELPPVISDPPPPLPSDPPPPTGGDGGIVPGTGTGGGGSPCENCSYGGSAAFGCTSTAARGSTVTCAVNASKDELSNVAVRSWRFTDADGNETQQSGGALTWQGPAVVGGTVTVRLDDGSGERELVSSFAVTARGWTWAKDAESVFSDGTGVQCSYWTTPDQGGSNGINLPMGAANCSVAKPQIQPDSYSAGDGFVAVTATTGPNQGFHYIQSARLSIRRESSYNIRLRPDAPQVQVLSYGLNQRRCATNWVNWYQFTLCQGVDPQGYIVGTHNHEGYGSTGHNGHYSAAYDAAVSAANDPMILFDQIVGTNSMDWGAFVLLVRDNFYKRARAVDDATRDIPNGGTIVTGNYSGIYYGYYAPQSEFLSHFRAD
jgi:hypothetical protein